MTPLEALAWTLPPSLALVVCCRLVLEALRQRALNAEDARLLGATSTATDAHDVQLARHEAELHRLGEQVSLLADRYR